MLSVRALRSMSPILLGEVPGTLQVADGPITVVIAEDSYLIRESLVHMLGGQDRVEIVAVCTDPAALEFAIAGERPRVVITETRMLGSTPSEGIELAARLRRTNPNVAVLVLTRDADAGYVEQLLEHDGSSGRGYVLKHRIRHSGELISAIEAVARGESVVDPEIVSALVRRTRRWPPSPLAELTVRERQLLALVAEGQSNAAIAESLVITKRAVEKHLNSIFHKLGLEASRSTHISRRVTAALMFISEQKGLSSALTDSCGTSGLRFRPGIPR
jgi:DNA-binding NarL/FixJ family response regulator